MPCFSEIGPLILDKKIQVNVNELHSKKKGNFNLKCELIFCESVEFFSGEITFEINFENFTISTNDDINQKKILITKELAENFPNIEIIKNSNSKFRLYIDEKNFFLLISKNHIERDIIAMAVRMFCGQKIIDRVLNSNEKKVN